MLENTNKEWLNVVAQVSNRWKLLRTDIQNRARMPCKSRMARRKSYPRRASVHDRECGQVWEKYAFT